MCNIFPSNGQIFFSSLSVQMNSGKQAVLGALSLSQFRLYQCPAIMTHSSSGTRTQLASLYCTDFRCNASPYILEAFQTSNMPARMFCCWILSRTGYEGCRTPRSPFSGKLKKWCWSFGLTMEQENEMLKPPGEGESHVSFLKPSKISWAARGGLSSHAPWETQDHPQQTKEKQVYGSNFIIKMQKLLIPGNWSSGFSGALRFPIISQVADEEARSSSWQEATQEPTRTQHILVDLLISVNTPKR